MNSQYWLISGRFRPHCLVQDGDGLRRGVDAEDGPRRVAGDQVDHEEHDDRHADGDRYEHQQPRNTNVIRPTDSPSRRRPGGAGSVRRRPRDSVLRDSGH